jgi:hypothetical protein
MIGLGRRLDRQGIHGALIEWLAGADPSGASPPHEQEPAAEDYVETV